MDVKTDNKDEEFYIAISIKYTIDQIIDFKNRLQPKLKKIIETEGYLEGKRDMGHCILLKCFGDPDSVMGVASTWIKFKGAFNGKRMIFVKPL